MAKKKIEENVIRVSPSLFDEKPVMIGRNKKDKVWSKFKWGEKNDLVWEYCPLTYLNKHLVGTTDDYSEIDESQKYEDDIDVNESKEDIEEACKVVDGLSDKQIGICAMYSVYKYGSLIGKKEFVLADNYRNIVISIMNNEEFKKYNAFINKMKSMSGKTEKDEKV